MYKLIFATGGTGGHIFPALAVAEEIRRRYPEWNILFMGGKFGPEKKIIQAKNFPFIALPVRGLMGRGIKGVYQVAGLSWSVLKSFYYLKKYKPDLVMGFGSYAAFPPIWAAQIMGLKTIIHEQNASPGMANRVLGKKATKIFLSFPDEYSFFPAKKVIITGNPVRTELFLVQEKTNFSARNLLVLGGSQGATVINRAILDCLKELKAARINIWHQTGPKDYAMVKEKYSKTYPKAKVDAFIEDMVKAYEFADLVLCRAGATTIAELSVVKRPSLLIPYPYATYDHQLKNARVLERVGAGLIIMQPYLGEINLATIITDLLDTPQKLQQMALNYTKLGNNNALENIIEELKKIINS
ncbi:MAG: undecaprenyldiphospho-muramoylpentapeptide beta-N-acetylglucosaminyltransferase [Desulfonauticus sp.]|nr:undecaprenyldiphospho-muramoylpentapeptide beta-N-acetylglucosaminyltransferase [Desulfonauticus sp.]